MASRRQFAHDDDDPFYDHEEATQQRLAANTAPAVRASSRLARSSSHGSTARTTLMRTTSAGRATTTFDDFLSDGSSSDEDDDGGGIQRMQEQADDMEYIDTSFRLDSPNSSGVQFDDGDNDDSFRMHTPPSGVAQALRSGTTEARASQSVKVSLKDDSDGSDSSDDGSDSEDEIDASFSSTTKGFAGHNDSFAGSPQHEDEMDSSFQLISPNAVAMNGRGANYDDDDSFADGRPSDQVSGVYSGKFNDTSFVLNSPNASGYLDDNDSFIGDGPGHSDYKETLDDSFAGDRPSSLNDDDDEYREALDDSFASDRPSNPDGDYDNSFVSDRPSFEETLDDSFAGDRATTIAVKPNETADDSFIGDRPSNLDREYSETLDDSFAGGQSPSIDNSDRQRSSNNLPDGGGSDSNGHDRDDGTMDDSIAGKSDHNEALDDSFAGRPSDDDLNNSMADIDYSFRENSLTGDYLEDNDSFVDGMAADMERDDGEQEEGDDKSLSFVWNVPRAGFGEASQQQVKEGSHDQQASEYNADATFERESAESASLSSSFSRRTGFFVGSAPESFPNGMSFAPLAVSPAMSDVVMLGGDTESSSLDQHSYALRSSGTVSPGVPGSGFVSVTTGEFDRRNTAAQIDQSSLLPAILANVRRVDGATAEAQDSAPRVSTASSISSEDKLPFVSFNVANGSPVRRSSDAGRKGDPVVLASGSQAIARASDQRSSSKGNSARKSDISSVSSGGSGDSIDDTSFTSSMYSEVAARHLESRSSDTSSGKGSEDRARVGVPSELTGRAPPVQAASPPQYSANSAMNASRPTDEKIDFTGVFRESGQSLDIARSSDHGRSTLESSNAEPLLDNQREEPTMLLAGSPVRLRRATSESIQRESERKVEDFFRRTYNLNKEENNQDFGSGRNRARTTVAFNVQEEEVAEEPSGLNNDAARQRSKSAGAKKTIDLRYLRPRHGAFALQVQNVRSASGTRSRGVSAASSRLEISEDLLDVPDAASEQRNSRLTFRSSGDSSSSIDSTEHQILSEKMQSLEATRRQQNESMKEMNSSRVIQRNFTISIPSEARSSDSKSTLGSLSEDSPNKIPMPPRHMLSPQAQSPMDAKSTSAFSVSQVMKKPGLATRADRDNGNTVTPNLPRLSVASGPSLTPSPFSASYAGLGSSKANSGTPGMAPGFKWNAQQQLHSLDSRPDGSDLGMKESIWHQAAIPRHTLSESIVNQFTRVSSSLRNTLQRAGIRLFGQQAGPNVNDPTSPQSMCSAPPKLSRRYDDRNFYARFGRGGGVEDNDEVIAVKQMIGRNQNLESVFKKRKVRMMAMLLSALLGISLGIGLIHVGALSSAFNLPREKQLEQQSSNGELKISMTTQWILLPGQLFLRVWNCVTMPLLFCHILNGIADLTMNDKASLVLSFRAIGYMLILSLFSTLEGLGMMAMFKSFGVFGGSNASVRRAAVALRKTLGAADRKNGSVALMCEPAQQYLQVSNNGQTFRCSNATIPLPVYEGVAENGTSTGNSAAIFVFNDVNSVLQPKVPTDSMAYYPAGLRLNQIGMDLVNSVVPNNAADSLIRSTPLSTVMIALFLGVVCGKRAWERGIAAKQQFASSRIDAAAGQAAGKPHYILGVFVELQLALEWIADVLETLAPIGAASLLFGNVVLHRQELMTIVSPMMQLILVVLLICAVHVAIAMPAFMKVFFKVNVFKSWTAFLPAYLFCFCTGSVVLSLPTAQQCYEKGNVVTKSMAQVAMGISSVLHRNAHAIYYPVVIVWLMQTNAQAQDVELTTSMAILIGVLTLVSCFVAFHPVSSVLSGANGGSNLLLIMTLWRAILVHENSPAATMTPPTFPLLVACDVILSRFIAMVNLHDNMLVTRMVAEHCDEVVREGTSLPVNSVGLAPSPMYM
ncbi:Transmembrane protein, partial [Globisporangium splendens]